MEQLQLNPILKQLLKHPNEYISGEFLAQKLGITRSAIHKKISKLRNEGYLIHAQKGFKLSQPLPYNLIAEKVCNYLQEDDYPNLLFINECDSTNTLAKNLIINHNNPFILISRGQTSGRGRMNRSWAMHYDHDIAFSFAIPCTIDNTNLFSIIRLASLSVYNVLSKYSNDLLIKWPNDIITKQGKKLCGILTESILEENQIRYLIIGIGININSTNHPEYAISLRDIIDDYLDINKILAEIIISVSNLWNKFPNNIDNIITEWNNYIAWIGEDVTLAIQDKTYIGKLKSVLKDGSLILLIDNQEHIFFVGDLTLKIRKNA